MGEGNRQIEALETELARLRETLNRLGAAIQETVPAGLEAAPPRPNAAEFQIPSFYWLGKLAATLAVALFCAVYFVAVNRAESGPVPAVAAAVAVVLLGWGAYAAQPGLLMPQTALACGLGGLFVSGTTFAAAHPSAFSDVLLLCLLAGGAVVARWRRSEAAFAVMGALACLCALPKTGFSGAGGLGMSLALCLCALLLAGPRSGTFPLWTASAAACAQLAPQLVLYSPSHDAIPALAGLLLAQAVATLGCVRYAARAGQRIFNAALLAFANCLLGLAVASSVLDALPGYAHAAGMVTAAALFAALAGAAHHWRPSTHLLMAALSTASMAAAAMAMWSGLPEAFFAPALAAGAAALVVVHRQTGSPLIRRLETLSALAAFGFCLFRLQHGGPVPMGPATLPANWMNALGTMLFLSVGAMLHEKCYPGGQCPEVRHGKAMARAALAGLVLLTITVLDRGADTALPFVLAAESLGLIGLSLVLLTPQIGVAGMLLLGPAHLCYHALLMQPQSGFAMQPDFAANTAGLIAFTLAGAVCWESYLRRFHLSTAEWDHYAVVALPFAAAAYLCCTLLHALLPPSLYPAALAATGVACLLPARLLRLDGMTVAAIFCLGASIFAFGRIAQDTGPGPDWLFVPGAACTAALFVLVERLTTRLFPGGTFGSHWSGQDARSVLSATTAATVAVTAVICATQGAALGWGLVGTGLVLAFAGWFSRCACYCWLGSFVALFPPLFAVLHFRGMYPGLAAAAGAALFVALAAAGIQGGLRRKFREDPDEAR